jgi:plasmid stabilization system protein ParE
MALRWTKTALGSVDEIAEFIAKDNPSRATSLMLELKDAVQVASPPRYGQGWPGPRYP